MRIIGRPEHEREKKRRHRGHRDAERDVAEDVERREVLRERIEQLVQHLSHRPRRDGNGNGNGNGRVRHRVDRLSRFPVPDSRFPALAVRRATARSSPTPREALNSTMSPPESIASSTLAARSGSSTHWISSAGKPEAEAPSPIARARGPTQISRSARPTAYRPVSRCHQRSSAPSSSMSPRTAICRSPGSSFSVSRAARIEGGLAL